MGRRRTDRVRRGTIGARRGLTAAAVAFVSLAAAPTGALSILPPPYVQYGYGGPATANGDGRLEVFGVNDTGQLFTVFQHAVGAGWSDFARFPLPPGVAAKGPVSTARHPDGRLQIAFLGQNDAIYTTGQLAGEPGWRTIQEVGQGGVTFTSPPVLAENPDGRIEMFAVTTAGVLVHAWNSTPPGFDFNFSGWFNMGSPHTLSTDPGGAIGVVANSLNGPYGDHLTPAPLVLYATSSTGTLLRFEQLPVPQGWAPAEELPGSPVGRPAAARNQIAFFDYLAGVWTEIVTYRNAAGGLGFTRWAGAPEIPTVTGTIDADPIPDEPTMAVNPDGRVEVFYRNATGTVRHAYQDTPKSLLGPPLDLGGGCARQPTVAKNDDGRLEVFCVGTDAALHHDFQVVPNGGWHGWTTLGGTLSD